MSSLRPLRKDFSTAAPVPERVRESWHAERRAAGYPSKAVGSRFGRRDYLIRRLLALADAASVVFALVAMVLDLGARRLGPSAVGPAARSRSGSGCSRVYGLYNRDIKRISHSTVDDIPWILHAVLVACLLTWLYFNLLHIPSWSSSTSSCSRRHRHARHAPAALARRGGSRSGRSAPSGSCSSATTRWSS